MADSNTLFLLVSYTVFVSVLQNILFTETTILIPHESLSLVLLPNHQHLDSQELPLCFPHAGLNRSSVTEAGADKLLHVPKTAESLLL